MADHPTYLRYLKTCDQAKAQQWNDCDVYIEPLPIFSSSVAALEYATDLVRRLATRAADVDALDSCELTIPLAQVHAILSEVTSLHAELHQETQ